MIRAILNYFVPKDAEYYTGHPTRRPREIKWGRLAMWTYPAIAVFTFGHLWVHAPVETCRYISNDYGGGFRVEIVASGVEQVTDENGHEWNKDRIKCVRDGWWTGVQALAGGATWPLTASIALSQELSGIGN